MTAKPMTPEECEELSRAVADAVAEYHEHYGPGGGGGLWASDATRLLATVDQLRAELRQEKEGDGGMKYWHDQAVEGVAYRDELRVSLHAAESTIDALRAELRQAKEDMDSMTRELSTICGGSGKPREGETRTAYWLRRVGAVLADEVARRALAESARDTAVRERDALVREANETIVQLDAALTKVATEKARADRYAAALREIEPMLCMQLPEEQPPSWCSDGKHHATCRARIVAAALDAEKVTKP